MNEIQVFQYESNEIRVVEKPDGPWWVLSDVCRVLDVANPRNISARLDEDEKGVHQIDTPGGKQEMTVINEPGLYNVILRSDKPQAKAFKRWVTHEVLPAIRKTGSYSKKPMTDYQQKLIETRERNSRIRSAQILERMAAKYKGTAYEQVLNAQATKELTGEYLLPLPQTERKTYTATEIGEMLGISANKVGKLANQNGLKTKEFGGWYHDKSAHSAKEVESFRYYDNVIPELKKALGQQ